MKPNAITNQSTIIQHLLNILKQLETFPNHILLIDVT